MSFTRAKALAYMKERWVDKDDMMLAIAANSPALGMLEKSNKMLAGGRYMHLPLLKTGAQGRSATYSTANTNASGSDTAGFDVTYVSNHQPVKVPGDQVDDMSGDENALVEALDHEAEAAIANMRKDLQHDVFGNAGGARGRIGSIGTGIAGSNCRITLLSIQDAKFFDVGVKLAVSANDGTAVAHALRASGATITITGIDKIKGYLEFASDVTASISGIAANDYMFADGDFKLKASGFRGWLPLTDPVSGDSFFGVDRTVNVQVLSGLRYDATGKPIEQAFVDGAGYADLYDAHFDMAIINPVRWAKFANSLGADRANRITKMEGTAGKAMVSYSAIMIATNFGEVPVVADGGCGIDEGLGLTKSTWVIGHVGGEGQLVRIVDSDGNTVRRDSSGGDSWQQDIKARWNLGCRQPGRNMRFTFSSLT